MNGRDQKKLCDAGYTIIRRDDQPSIRIKYKKKGIGEWQTLIKDFASKAARDRHMNELLCSAIIIED